MASQALVVSFQREWSLFWLFSFLAFGVSRLADAKLRIDSVSVCVGRRQCSVHDRLVSGMEN